MNTVTVPIAEIRGPQNPADLLDELRRCAVSSTETTVTVDLASACYGAIRSKHGPIAERLAEPTRSASARSAVMRRGCPRCPGRRVAS